MTTDNIIAIIGIGIGGLGLGGIITNVVNSFYIGRAEKRKLLFEARTKAYGQLIGKIRNFFLPDLLEIESHKRSYEFNIIFSEVSLLSSKELSIALEKYSKIVGEYFDEIQKVEDRTKDIKNDEITKIKFNLLEKNLQIIELMRKDLYIL